MVPVSSDKLTWVLAPSHAVTVLLLASWAVMVMGKDVPAVCGVAMGSMAKWCSGPTALATVVVAWAALAPLVGLVGDTDLIRVLLVMISPTDTVSVTATLKVIWCDTPALTGPGSSSQTNVLPAPRSVETTVPAVTLKEVGSAVVFRGTVSVTLKPVAALCTTVTDTV